MSWNDLPIIYNHITRMITLFGYGVLVTMLTAELALLSLMVARKKLENLGGYRLMEWTGRAVTVLYFVPVVYGAVWLYHLGGIRGLTSGTESIRGDGTFKITGWMWITALVFLVVWAVKAAWRLGQMSAQRKSEMAWLSRDYPAPLEWEELLRDMCRAMGIRRKVILRQRYGLDSPLTYGIVHVKITVPAHRFSRRELEVIFTHELEHIRRKDVLVRAVLNVAECVFWFCPLVRKLHPMLVEWSETCCDIIAVKRLGDAREYFSVMLKYAPKAESDASSRTVCRAAGDEVMERVGRMKNYQNAKKNSKRLITLIALGLMMTLMGTTTALAAGEGVAVLSNVIQQSTKPVDVYENRGVNDGVEYVDYVTPEETGRIPVENPVQEFYSNFKNIGWIVSPNHVGYTPYFTAANGDTIRIMMEFTPEDQTVYVGIYCPSGKRRYLIVTGGVNHDFILDESGPYSVFVENISMTNDLEVVGAYIY